MQRLLRILRPACVVLVFAGALWLLYHELRRYRYEDILESFTQIPAAAIFLALALTALNYVILTGYEFIALRNVGQSPGLGRTALASFTGFTLSNNLGWILDGPSGRDMRTKCRHLEDLGCTFRIILPEDVGPMIAALRKISDAWLAHEAARENGFSLGVFLPGYLQQCPVALVEQSGRPIAFANVLRGACREELSVDLMRYEPDAPSGTMDYLFAELMRWGRDQGYRWFSLGMAPLSDIEEHHLAPLSSRVAAVVFRHGEHFHSLQGLREYKQKFDPQWKPKYLASPSGLALPLVLSDIAALIARPQP